MVIDGFPVRFVIEAIGINNYNALQDEMGNTIMQDISTGKLKPTSGTCYILYAVGIGSHNEHKQVWVEIDWILEKRGRLTGLNVGTHCILVADSKQDFYADEILDRYIYLKRHLDNWNERSNIT